MARRRCQPAARAQPAVQRREPLAHARLREDARLQVDPAPQPLELAAAQLGWPGLGRRLVGAVGARGGGGLFLGRLGGEDVVDEPLLRTGRRMVARVVGRALGATRGRVVVVVVPRSSHCGGLMRERVHATVPRVAEDVCRRP